MTCKYLDFMPWWIKRNSRRGPQQLTNGMRLEVDKQELQVSAYLLQPDKRPGQSACGTDLLRSPGYPRNLRHSPGLRNWSLIGSRSCGRAQFWPQSHSVPNRTRQSEYRDLWGDKDKLEPFLQCNAGTFTIGSAHQHHRWVGRGREFSRGNHQTGPGGNYQFQDEDRRSVPGHILLDPTADTITKEAEEAISEQSGSGREKTFKLAKQGRLKGTQWFPFSYTFGKNLEQNCKS